MLETHTLGSGARVRLRLVRPGDEQRIQALLSAIHVEAHEFELARLVRFDPRRLAVICATALVDSSERIVGVGAVDLAANRPHTLIADRPELAVVLTQALIDRASAHATGSAA